MKYFRHGSAAVESGEWRKNKVSGNRYRGVRGSEDSRIRIQCRRVIV
jgi:hypothetical protein